MLNPLNHFGITAQELGPKDRLEGFDRHEKSLHAGTSGAHWLERRREDLYSDEL